MEIGFLKSPALEFMFKPIFLGNNSVFLWHINIFFKQLQPYAKYFVLPSDLCFTN